jgi:DNA-binding protein YbaB
MTEIMAQVQEQIADIAAVQEKQAELTANGTAADGMIEVTVDAHGLLVKTVIDESYLEYFEFDELSDHITEAVQAAAQEASRQVAEMMVPIGERRRQFPSLSDIVEGAPDLRDLTEPVFDPATTTQPPPDPDEGNGQATFLTVRR